MFADKEFYINEYSGVDIDDKELDKLIKRANRDIDLLTNGKIVMEKLSKQNQDRVKNAVCAQVEFLSANGELSSSIGTSDSFSIGQYSESNYRQGYKKAENSYYSRYSPLVFEYLKFTGLLYGYYYESVDYI